MGSGTPSGGEGCTSCPVSGRFFHLLALHSPARTVAVVKETHSRSRGNCISVPFIPSKKRLVVSPLHLSQKLFPH